MNKNITKLILIIGVVSILMTSLVGADHNDKEFQEKYIKKSPMSGHGFYKKASYVEKPKIKPEATHKGQWVNDKLENNYINRDKGLSNYGRIKWIRFKK